MATVAPVFHFHFNYLQRRKPSMNEIAPGALEMFVLPLESHRFVENEKDGISPIHLILFMFSFFPVR